MGGGSTRARNVVKGLTNLGHKITVIAGFPHYPHGDIPKKLRLKTMISVNNDNFRLIRVWLPPLPHRGFARRMVLFASFMLSSLFPLFLVGDVQVVWAANPNFFAFFPAMLYGLIKRCPVVRNVDDLWPEVPYNLGLIRSRVVRRMIDFISKMTYKLPSALTPISPSYASFIMDKYKVNPNRIHVIEVGVDLDVFNPGVDSKSCEYSFNVMYSGILGPGYNFDIILNVAKKISVHEDIHFIIRGVGELAPFIKEKVKNEKI